MKIRLIFRQVSVYGVEQSFWLHIHVTHVVYFDGVFLHTRFGVYLVHNSMGAAKPALQKSPIAYFMRMASLAIAMNIHWCPVKDKVLRCRCCIKPKQY